MVGKVREISICNMWLWVGFSLASAVISKNTVLATGARVPQVSRNANCEEVLLKTWTMFAYLLNADGMTVNVPNRDYVIYALTLIKKSIQDNEDNEYDNVPLKQKLFLREAELASNKGVYLYDNRTLQTLLDQEIIPNENRNLNFEYGLKTNDNPSCREAFRKLMQSTYEGYDNLANSPFCIAPYGVLPSQYTVYNPGYPSQFVGFNDKVKNPTGIPGKDQPAIFNDKIQPPLEANTVSSANILPNGQNLNPGDSNKLVHAVNLSKETNQLLGGDYMANLEHAKGVADNMNKLYQSSNSYEYSLTAHQPLRKLKSKFVSIDAGPVNKPLITSFYSKPAVVQTSYVAQSLLNTQGDVNKDNNLSVENTYMYAPVPSMQSNAVVNQSYTLISNTVQSQVAANAATSAGAGIQNTFVNAKWHPNPAYLSEPSKEDLPPHPPVANIKYEQQILSAPKPTVNMQNRPYGSNKVVPIPQNIHGLSDTIPTKVPTRSNVPQPFVPRNQFSYNTYPFVYPYSSNRWNYLQNNAYKLAQNPNQRYLFSNYNFYPQVSAVRPVNQLQYQKRVFQAPIKLNTQNSLLMRQNYFRQNQPNMVYGQTLVQNIPQYQTYGVNVLNKPLQYGAYNKRYVNNIPFMQQTLNYNNQPIIDKLATWISGTNSVKLNSNFDSEAEIELTYKVIKPPPVYQPTVFYVKFRMPYQQFAKRLNDFLKIQNSRSASPDTDLYNNLASQYNATVIPSGMTDIAQEDIKSPEGKVLVRARYIQPNESENGNANSVDIINLDKQTEENNANIKNPFNNEASAAEIQMQGVQSNQ